MKPDVPGDLGQVVVQRRTSADRTIPTLRTGPARSTATTTWERATPSRTAPRCARLVASSCTASIPGIHCTAPDRHTEHDPQPTRARRTRAALRFCRPSRHAARGRTDGDRRPLRRRWHEAHRPGSTMAHDAGQSRRPAESVSTSPALATTGAAPAGRPAPNSFPPRNRSARTWAAIAPVNANDRPPRKLATGDKP